MAISKEQQFLNALEGLFVGAKIKGQGWFINLLNIKHQYYQSIVKPALKDFIDTRFAPTNAGWDNQAREELFAKLYSFFEKYFSETGSIYFQYHMLRDGINVYDKIYTKDDTALFYKTHMLYYVKSEKIWKDADITLDNDGGQIIIFSVNTNEIELAGNNNKKEVIFTYKGLSNNKITLWVSYSSQWTKSKIDDIVKQAKIDGKVISDELVEKAISIYVKQSEVDYFINKNANAFLKEQFNLWFYQYTFVEEEGWKYEGFTQFNEKRLRQLQYIKEIAFKIIDFISQFEDELVKIWNKPKFVRNCNYIISIDKFEDAKILNKVLTHKNISSQIKEWIELWIIETVDEKLLIGNPKSNEFKYLPIDTKYFSDIKDNIIWQFDNLDNKVDGTLIKSENYQAIQTLQNKFYKQVQCIYIDPPFNLWQNADYAYKVNYKDANRATLLENRLRNAYALLSEEGSIFVRCDYNGNFIVRCLLDSIFGKENFRNEIIVNKSNQQWEMDWRLNPATDFLFLYSKGKINPLRKSANRKEEKWLEMHSPKQNTNSHSVFFEWEELIAPKNRHWTFSQDKVNLMTKEGRIRVSARQYTDVHWNPQTKILEYKLSESTPIDSNWTDITWYSSTTWFTTENSESLLQRVIQIGSKKTDLIMDFFAWSATTQAVAQKLWRKRIWVEAWEQFNSIEIPRLKKVLSWKQGGISKELEEKYVGGGIIKYYSLEQYIDVLEKASYGEDTTLFAPTNAFDNYIFLKDPKFTKALNIDNKQKKVTVDLSKLYDDIDIPETLSNLLGKKIKSIKDNIITFEDGTVRDTDNLDYMEIKPLIWW